MNEDEAVGMRFAYADPPYRGCCGLYDHFHNGGGPMPWDGECWDDFATHAALIDWLTDTYPDGWALSCNPKDLRDYLPLCPSDVRVGPWGKTFHQIRPTSVQWAWEPLIWRGGRDVKGRNPMVRDWIACPATQRRAVKGAKPDVFNQWVIDLLGVTEDDTLDDLFPGSGSMSAALACRPLDFGAAVS